MHKYSSPSIEFYDSIFNMQIFYKFEIIYYELLGIPRAKLVPSMRLQIII